MLFAFHGFQIYRSTGGPSDLQAAARAGVTNGQKDPGTGTIATTHGCPASGEGNQTDTSRDREGSVSGRRGWPRQENG